MDLPTPSTQKLQSIDGRSARGGGLDARQLERLGWAAGRSGGHQPAHRHLEFVRVEGLRHEVIGTTRERVFTSRGEDPPRDGQESGSRDRPRGDTGARRDQLAPASWYPTVTLPAARDGSRRPAGLEAWSRPEECAGPAARSSVRRARQEAACRSAGRLAAALPGELADIEGEEWWAVQESNLQPSD